MTETKQNTETIENKIKELNNEIKYEEERLKHCGYGKSDLLYLENLKIELAKLEELLDNLE